MKTFLSISERTNEDDELYGKISLTTSTTCSSFDQTYDFSDSFESRNEKSKQPPSSNSIVFKLRTPERRRSRRGSFSSSRLSSALPPVIAPTLSFDILDDEESAKAPPPSLADRRPPIFRVAPLQLVRSRSSPVKNKNLLSKSLTLSSTTSAAIADEISVVESISSCDIDGNQDDPALHEEATITAPSSKNNTSWFPLIEIKRSRDLQKKSVHFQDDANTVHLIHFDWSSAADYFYTSDDITAMKSARYEDAAFFHVESSQSAVDDLDMSRRRSILCIDTLLQTALYRQDDDPTTSIRGIEHFVYPELQQEMIRRKKEVQSQVLSFVKSKRPDPQGWRLANHSRMYSKWARDVALEKGMAYSSSCDVGDNDVVDDVFKNSLCCQKAGQEEEKVEDNTTTAAASIHRMPLRRKGSGRTRRASVCSSMPSVGDGAAAAAAVQMAFFNAIREEARQEEDDLRNKVGRMNGGDVDEA